MFVIRIYIATMGEEVIENKIVSFQSKPLSSESSACITTRWHGTVAGVLTPCSIDPNTVHSLEADVLHFHPVTSRVVIAPVAAFKFILPYIHHTPFMQESDEMRLVCIIKHTKHSNCTKNDPFSEHDR